MSPQNSIWQLIVWAGVILGCFVLIPDPTHAQAMTEYVFERMWPPLQQPWYFNRPQSVALDRHGAIYIVDWDSQIMKFSTDGRFILSWGSFGSGPSQFWSPQYIAVDAVGNMYVADGLNHRIQKFDSSGKFMLAWGTRGSGPGQFNLPRGIAFDVEGNVYVADQGHPLYGGSNDRIETFDSDGHYLSEWGSEGGGAGQFRYPGSVTVDSDGFVYVADTGNNRVQKFTTQGAYVTEWGTVGSGSGQFREPRDIKAGSDGRIYVADTILTGDFFTPELGNHRIQIFSSDGAFVDAFGGLGHGDGQFWLPFGLDVDDQGVLYIADLQNTRIQKVRSNGQFLAKWGPIGTDPGEFLNNAGMTTDADGNLYVVDMENNRIQVFAPNGIFLRQWGALGTDPGQFKRPWGVTNHNGFVYVADSENHRIQKFSLAGDAVGSWGTFGSSDGQFKNPVGVAVDSTGKVYVSDRDNGRVQVFDGDGNHLASWPLSGTPWGIAIDQSNNVAYVLLRQSTVLKLDLDGNSLGSFGSGLSDAYGVSVDASGNVYVADSGNHRVAVFSSDGTFRQAIGEFGKELGKFNYCSSVHVDTAGNVYVGGDAYSRIQKLKPRTLPLASKAVIVAGGGPFPGNDLWPATEYCANFAYRTLVAQQFTSDSIRYLSADTTLDLDDNGVPDVDADATNANLQDALTQWALDATNLVVFLVDHGGDQVFRMSATETLSAADIAVWLDVAQAKKKPGTITVIYEACQSGSFVSALTRSNRIVIASAASGENSYFLGTGAISFSSFFWTNIFCGYGVLDSYTVTLQALHQTFSLQTPQLADPTNLAGTAFIGNGTVMVGSRPQVVAVSPEQTINGTNTALLFADPVQSDSGLARVWAVIRPPDFAVTNPDSPVQNLPTLELTQVPLTQRWEGSYAGFTTPGTYQIAVYAQDPVANTSLPKLTSVSVLNPLRRKAIIVAGGAQTDPLWPAVQNTVLTAYRALGFQGYKPEDIRFYAPVAISPGWTGTNVLSNVDPAVNIWAADQCRDMVLYFVGDGSSGSFKLNQTETLTGAMLETWLNGLQTTLPGKVTVVYDASHSGSFIAALAPPAGKQRIVIASAATTEPASFLSGGDVSFSNFFWRQVLNGATAGKAYTYANTAMRFSANGQSAQMDDNGNGIANEKSDGRLARSYTIGTGVLLAGDDPLIGSVSAPQTINGVATALLRAEHVTSTNSITRVWEVITPPPSAAKAKKLPIEFGLTAVNDTAFTGVYRSFTDPGQYQVAVFAKDQNGNVSLPVATTVTQLSAMVLADAFEPDDAPQAASFIGVGGFSQPHNFHVAGDQDWAMFYVVAPQVVTIDTTNVGSAADTVITLFSGNGSTQLDQGDTAGPGQDEVLLFTATQTGFYYVRVTDADPTVFDAGTDYTLRVFVEAGGTIPGSITGVVTNALTDAPIPTATVRLTVGVSATVTTNEDGVYAFPGLPENSYPLEASAIGYHPSGAQIVYVQSGQIKTLDFGLNPIVGDVNHTGSIDAVDVQLVINAALSLPAVYDCDINHDGKVDAVDVQMVINAALSLG